MRTRRPCGRSASPVTAPRRTTSCSARCCAGQPTCRVQIAEAAGDVALLAALVAEIAPGAQRADAAGAAILAEGAARAAAQLVDVNLAARPGDERHARAHEAVAAAAAASASLGGREDG